MKWRWMADPAIAGVGAFGDLGTHSLDVMLWMMGGSVTTVTGNVDVATERNGDCDEYGEALLKFANGAIGSIAAGWVDLDNPASLIISGTEGIAYLASDGLHSPHAWGWALLRVGEDSLLLARNTTIYINGFVWQKMRFLAHQPYHGGEPPCYRIDAG